MISQQILTLNISPLVFQEAAQQECLSAMVSADRRSLLAEVKELRDELDRLSQGDRDTGVQLHLQLQKLEEKHAAREKQLKRQGKKLIHRVHGESKMV